MREHRRRRRELFVPLGHPPGHAQADLGEARVVIGAVEQKAHFFAFSLPYSDACYVRARRQICNRAPRGVRLGVPPSGARRYFVHSQHEGRRM